MEETNDTSVSPEGSTNSSDIPQPTRQEKTPKLIGKFGHYDVRELLGTGAFGRVYKAYDPRLERFVALKLPTFMSTDQQRVMRFIAEAKHAARLSHPNIVQVYESGRIGERHFIATQYIQGETLAARLKREPLTLRQSVELVCQLADALEYAHQQGIIHRDIKPENIMMDSRGRPLIMDFGLAKRLDDDANLTRDGALLGTPAYMSPEQARGNVEQLRPASDQYSLGVVLYRLLCGDTPFSGPAHAVIANVAISQAPSLAESDPSLPAELIAICDKVLCRDPQDRYSNCNALKEDLAQWLAGRPVSAKRRLYDGRLGKKRKWHDNRWVQVAISGAGLAILAGMLMALRRGESQPANDVALLSSQDSNVSSSPPAQEELSQSNENESSNQTLIGEEIAVDGTSNSTENQTRDQLDSIIPSTIHTSIGVQLKLIPAGEFLMGSPEGETEKKNETQHLVRISRPFYMGTHEITRGQFSQFVSATGYVTEAETDGRGGWGMNSKGESAQRPEYTWRNTGFPQTDQHPVGNVTWNDANAFCEWLSRVEGRKFRLPTEAEWEFACRANTVTAFFHGDDPIEIGQYANIFDVSAQWLFPRAEFVDTNDGYMFSAPVGSFSPNGFGLFDMHGNVMEWCSDWYDDYSSAAVTDPVGPAEGMQRIVRGGSMHNPVSHARSANRNKEAPVTAYANLGFRVASDIPQ